MNKAHALLQVLLLVSVSVAFGHLTAQAQSREKFVISAKAGGINTVTGRTGMHGKGESEWQQLTIKDNLEAGDVVRTSMDGRVEMLLNPGSYMRVAENSEFELVNNSLDNLEVRLVQGTAIVEATGADDTEMLINITTPHAKMSIVRRGLYRVNVVPGDATELIVRKGRVLLTDSQTKIKGGKKLRFSGGTFFVAKLEKADKEKDVFDVWSKERAETVAKANQKISNRDRNLLLASFMNGGSNDLLSRYSGIWFFNTRSGCYTFLPFFMGWGSPYGGSYSNSFYGGYYQTYGTSVSGYGTGSNSGGGNAGGGNQLPAPPPTQTSMPAPMRQIPPAAQGKVQRVNDPQH
jgi:FecR-like protein